MLETHGQKHTTESGNNYRTLETPNATFASYDEVKKDGHMLSPGSLYVGDIRDFDGVRLAGGPNLHLHDTGFIAGAVRKESGLQTLADVFSELGANTKAAAVEYIERKLNELNQAVQPQQ